MSKFADVDAIETSDTEDEEDDVVGYDDDIDELGDWKDDMDEVGTSEDEDERASSGPEDTEEVEPWQDEVSDDSDCVINTKSTRRKLGHRTATSKPGKQSHARAATDALLTATPRRSTRNLRTQEQGNAPTSPVLIRKRRRSTPTSHSSTTPPISPKAKCSDRGGTAPPTLAPNDDHLLQALTSLPDSKTANLYAETISSTNKRKARFEVPIENIQSSAAHGEPIGPFVVRHGETMYRVMIQAQREERADTQGFWDEIKGSWEEEGRQEALIGEPAWRVTEADETG
jgi:hypothetical protein